MKKSYLIALFAIVFVSCEPKITPYELELKDYLPIWSDDLIENLPENIDAIQTIEITESDTGYYGGDKYYYSSFIRAAYIERNKTKPVQGWYLNEYQLDHWGNSYPDLYQKKLDKNIGPKSNDNVVWNMIVNNEWTHDTIPIPYGFPELKCDVDSLDINKGTTITWSPKSNGKVAVVMYLVEEDSVNIGGMIYSSPFSKIVPDNGTCFISPQELKAPLTKWEPHSYTFLLIRINQKTSKFSNNKTMFTLTQIQRSISLRVKK